MPEEAVAAPVKRKRRKRRAQQNLPIKVTVKPVTGKAYTFFAFRQSVAGGIHTFILPSEQIGAVISRSIAVANVASIDVETSVLDYQPGVAGAALPAPDPPSPPSTHPPQPAYQVAPRPRLTSQMTPSGPRSLVEDGSGNVYAVNAGFMPDPSTGSM